MIKAVIFDRDGVIIDSESVHVNSFVSTYNEMGIDVSKGEMNHIAGKHPEDHVPPIIENYDVSYDDVRNIQRVKYLSMINSAKFFNDTIKILKKIHKLGLPIALTTTASLKTTSPILKKAKIIDLFKVIVTEEDYKKRKPDPEPYLVTARKLGVKPSECLVFEDSNSGLKSAKAAGMKCIIIYNEYTKNQDFSIADMVVGSAKEINLSEILK